MNVDGSIQIELKVTFFSSYATQTAEMKHSPGILFKIFDNVIKIVPSQLPEFIVPATFDFTILSKLLSKAQIKNVITLVCYLSGTLKEIYRDVLLIFLRLVVYTKKNKKVARVWSLAS